MKIFVKGKGDVTLNKGDFIAAGGQGSVYAKGNTAYKIYTDPNNMIPFGKIQELSSLTLHNIIKPENIICDAKSNVIGYTMSYVHDTQALCQLFTKEFKVKNNISPQDSFELAKKLQEIVQHVHDKGILIVDLNEMNFLLNGACKDIYAIDVDSYQTASFPATFIMESIRDRQVKNNQFNKGSDWFSFAIIAFQMMIGIHPYKGKHSTIKTMDERMVQNVSVFNPDVRIPPICYDFSVIPPNYLAWFKAVFDDGKRLGPPVNGQVMQIIQKITNVLGTNTFIVNKMYPYNEEIEYFSISEGVEICKTVKHLYINKILINSTRKGLYCVTPKNWKPLVFIDKGLGRLVDVLSDNDLPFGVGNEGSMEFDNRIYYKNGTGIFEVKILESGVNVIPSSKKVGNVISNAVFYKGCIIQNMLEAYYVSVFPKTETCYQVRIPQLTGYRIIDAKYENKVLMVVGEKGGVYDRLIMRFTDTFDEYDVRTVSDITFNGFNFTVLDNGICAHIPEDDVIELFSNRKDSTGLKVINDPFIKSDMKLIHNGVQTMFIKDNAVYTLKMKP